MTIGPLQLVVISFDNDANFHGQIQREIDAMRGRAETVRTLIVAGLLDEAEAESALDALTEAGLLDPAIVDEAATSASQHEARATALAEAGVTGTRT